MSYVWIDETIVNTIHDEQIVEHGGLTGIRDSALLQSALARPINLFSYNQDTKIADLAACYAVAIAKNHPFIMMAISVRLLLCWSYFSS